MQSSICFDVNLPSYRGVEQLVARRAHNPKVVGSSPAPATKTIKRLYYYSVTVFLFRINLRKLHWVLIRISYLRGELI